MMQLRTFFFRCPDCGQEFLHTVDMDNPIAVQFIDEAPLCHCGSVMQAAGIPKVVVPEPGGDGMIFEVEELER